MVVEFEGVSYVGYMHGNDGCFDGNEFFQYFTCEGKLYKFYFHIPEYIDEDFDFGTDIKYDKP